MICAVPLAASCHALACTRITRERALGHEISGIRATYDVYSFRAEKRAAFEALAAMIKTIVVSTDDPSPDHKKTPSDQ